MGRVAEVGQVPASYVQAHTAFRWRVPETFNMAEVCCGRWARRADFAARPAIASFTQGGETVFHSYAELQRRSNQLSNCLAALGVVPGDRVAIVMPQCFDTAVAYMAVLQMGAVAMPLSLLFGPDALEYRLRDSAAVLAVCDASAWVSLQTARAQCPALRGVLGAGDFASASGHGDQALGTAIAAQDSHFVPVPTRAADPAVLIYTSGTTGNPKGALIAHRALIGNLPGFVASQNGFGQAADSALAALSADPLPTASAVQS
ncbi:MAG: AMP-binding protein, partial [Rhodoferax sp.]|nr:AMP-binding protein [Rhodoferax sp.]MCF8211383.1 AMP-binding protein [Rhodoferax sp.]